MKHRLPVGAVWACPNAMGTVGIFYHRGVKMAFLERILLLPEALLQHGKGSQLQLSVVR